MDALIFCNLDTFLQQAYQPKFQCCIQIYSDHRDTNIYYEHYSASIVNYSAPIPFFLATSRQLNVWISIEPFFHFIIYYSLPLQYIYQPFHISQRQNKFLSKNKLENIHYSFIALEKIGYDGLIQWILTLKVNDLKVDKILWDTKKKTIRMRNKWFHSLKTCDFNVSMQDILKEQYDY